MKKPLLFLSMALALAACAPASTTPPPTGGDASFVTLVGPGEKRVRVIAEIADENDERAVGLMYRTSLEPNSGMLFVFPEPTTLTFWMKNTLMPLDILFFQEDGTYVSSTAMKPCEEDLCPTYPSAAPAMFALEVPAGFIARHSIDANWRLDWQR